MKYVFYVLGALLGLMILFILLVIVSSLFVKKKEYDKNSKYYRFLLHSSTAVGLKLSRIKIHTSGIEKIPKDSRYLLVCNHRSKFDPIITWHILHNPDIAFISKPENFNVPIYGRIIRKCCFMAIDRENAKNAILTIRQAAELIKKDEVSIGVYPEGTRNYEEGLLPFHNGIFKIAQLANVPIVVVAMRGTDKIKKNYPLKRSHVYFDVVDVLSAEYAKHNRTVTIGELVRDEIETKIKES